MSRQPVNCFWRYIHVAIICLYPLLFLLLQSADYPLPATTSVKLLFNGRVVATGIAVEGQLLHGKQIPSFYQKVALTIVYKKTKLLFKTPFDDDDCVTVGVIVAWPLNLIQS